MAKPERPCRIVFMGSGRVGKTCLIRRLIRLPQTDKYQPTIEDIYYRDVEKSDDHRQFKLEILDTSGSFNFAGMLTLSISKATCFVLVFAADDPYSMEHMKTLYDRIKAERQDFSAVPISVVCNKIDLVIDNDAARLKRQVEALEDQLELSDNQILLSSAKTNENVNNIFQDLWLQNQTKYAFSLPLPKQPSNWSILIKRRISVIEALKPSNYSSKPSNHSNEAFSSSSGKKKSAFLKRAQSISTNITSQMTSSASGVFNQPISEDKETEPPTQVSHKARKSIFKRSITAENKDWKMGETLKIDCCIS